LLVQQRRVKRSRQSTANGLAHLCEPLRGTARDLRAEIAQRRTGDTAAGDDAEGFEKVATIRVAHLPIAVPLFRDWCHMPWYFLRETARLNRSFHSF